MAIMNSSDNKIQEQDTYTTTLPEILQAQAAWNQNKTVFIFLKDGDRDEERITFSELFSAANEIAFHLIELKIKGERALMLYPAGLNFIKALFGCFLAGVIAVPAYPPRKNRSLERIKSMVVNSGASVVLTTDDIYKDFQRSFFDVTELKNLAWITTNDLDQKITHRSEDLSDRLKSGMPSPQDIALLQYTSGSTGQPKGVMVTHQNLVRNLEFLRQAFELSEETLAVHWLPVFHDMGLVLGVLESIYCGYTGVLMPPVSFIQKPVRWLRAISRYGATHSGAPNFAFELCVNAISEEECQGLDLSRIKTLYNGAEPVRKKTMDNFIQKFQQYGFKPEALYPTYGMAEATLILSGGKVNELPVVIHVDRSALESNVIKLSGENDMNASSMVSVGWPRIDTKIKVINPNTLMPCPEDEVGEIWVAGSIVTRGYWNNDSATSETFHAYTQDMQEGPFLRTGDLGFYHKGELFISGRLKDLIIIRGRNYYPQDIEYLAENSHHALRKSASAAFSITLEDEEKLVIVAEVERTSLRNLDVESVCQAIRQVVGEEMELSVYAVRLIRTASILKTSSGKIQRKACREAFLNNTLETVGESILETMKLPEETPQSAVDMVALQAWIMTWIHTKLKIPLDKIDFSKPIMVYGLSSMKAVQLQQDFLTRFGINFPPYLFFERISLAELSQRAFKLILEMEN